MSACNTDTTSAWSQALKQYRSTAFYFFSIFQQYHKQQTVLIIAESGSEICLQQQKYNEGAVVTSQIYLHTVIVK